MKPTVSRRSRAHVENHPPSENICCYIKFSARNKFFDKNSKRKDGPPAFEGRYDHLATFVHSIEQF